MKRKYPDDDAFHLAPNQGIIDDRGVKEMAEDHATGIADFGIGKKTNNAMLKDWSYSDVAIKQDGDGSMNYMAEKEKICSMDSGKLRRSMKKLGEAV